MAVSTSARELRVRPQIHVAMLGARMHYAVPRLFQEAGMLGRFYTDSYVGNKRWLTHLIDLIPRSLRPRAVDRLRGRTADGIPPAKVESFDLFGVGYWLRQRWVRQPTTLTSVYARSAGAFNRRALAAGVEQADAIWGYNGACLELFRQGRKFGIPCIVEQTIAPRAVRRGLLVEEHERWPGWQFMFEVPAVDDELGRREEMEWRLADRIVAGSQFVFDGLVASGAYGPKCRVVPYGVDLRHFSARRRSETSPFRPLSVLFVGTVSLRKGVPYLLEALRSIGPRAVQARLVGDILIHRERLEPYREVVSLFGPVPRLRMKELFDWADLLVLPSVCEGSATVTYEALACGIPVVTTPNAGSVVRDGRDGKLVPIRDSDALADALERYVRDRAYLRWQAECALNDRARVGLAEYRKNLVNTVLGL